MTKKNDFDSKDWENLSVSEQGNYWYLSLICLVASIGGLLFGFDTAVISGTFGFVEEYFMLSKLALGWFGSAALVGCIIGALIAGWLGDRFGRKPILIFGSFMFLVSALFSAIPPNFPILIVARIVGGIGVGIASVLAPMFISEFAPPKIRGRLAALYQLSIVIGILLAYFSNSSLLSFSRNNPEAFGGEGLLHWALVAEVWRGMFAAEMIPNIVFIALLLLVPESPRWLIEKGRLRAGFAILARIGGRAVATREMNEIQGAIEQEPGSLRELFQPGLRWAMIVALGLSIFGQMTGVNIVIYYGPMILEQAGIELGSAMQFQVALGIINLIFTIIAIWKVDTWGRRPLLIWGMAIVTLTMGTTAVLFALGKTGGFLIVIVLGAYMACVAISICAVIWVLTPEIFPNRVRGRAMSIAVFFNWTTNTLSAFLFPWYVDKWGMHVGFFTFAGICFIATIFFWKFVPETKGKSLEEIEKYWESRK